MVYALYRMYTGSMSIDDTPLQVVGTHMHTTIGVCACLYCRQMYTGGMGAYHTILPVVGWDNM